MAGGKESPRQKMIGVMYLVLMALLALNVSKDVINAFVVVNDNIVESNENIANKLEDIYVNFENNLQFNQTKVKPFWDKAQIARSLSAEMIVYIDSIRFELISLTEKISIEEAKTIKTRELNSKDNYDIPTNYFIDGVQNGYNGKAKQIRNRIDKFRERMLQLIDSNNINKTNFGLKTDGEYYNIAGLKEEWETHFFYNTILAADITILNKIISDIHNAEFDVVNFLHRSIGQGDFKFDKIEAKVLPNSKYIFSGEDYIAEIIVAAYDTTQSPTVYYKKGVDFLPKTDLQNSNKLYSLPGKTILRIPTNAPGQYKYAGFVRAISGNDSLNDYHFNANYVVTQPSYSISAKKMNVFYTGVDNPVSIDISGIPHENLIPTISCGTIKPDPISSDWIVNIPNGYTVAVVTITTNFEGTNKKLGSKKFRIKNIPNPIASIANKSSGIINKEIMMAAGSISPKMPDDFEFDHNFVISSFTMTLQRGFKVYNLDSKNSYLTSEMIDQIKRTNRGQSVVFENIIIRDSDGNERDIASIVLTIG